MSRRNYIRPLVQVGPARPKGALRLAGGWGWFTHVEVLGRGRVPQVLRVEDCEGDAIAPLTEPRDPIAGLSFDVPRIMGIINATPDSFSDGGLHARAEDAVAGGLRMREAGADMLDIGGESTRPGAETVETGEEIERTAPVIAGLRQAGVETLISIDTRKTEVAEAAVAQGAGFVNDVSGFTHDPALAGFCASRNLPVCVMHAQGDPATMQENPSYEDVLLDVYDFLEAQIARLVAAGIPHSAIVADPGIGFGKTLEHNLTLLARLSLFHGLGVPLLLGASRKRFIGTIGNAPQADARAPGSIGVALAGLAHGIQILRVHDVAETLQAVALWRAAMTGRHK